MSFHKPIKDRRMPGPLGLELLAVGALREAGLLDRDPFAGATSTEHRKEVLRPIFLAHARELFPPDHRVTYAEVWHALYGEQLDEPAAADA